MSNIQKVKEIYGAFRQANIPAILDCLAQDVEWEYGVNSTDVPWLQPRRGREAVVGFFESLGAVEFHRFQPKLFLESEGVVAALIDFEATVRSTGKRIVEEDEVHIWHFDASGKVHRFRHRADTHQHWAAYSGRG